MDNKETFKALPFDFKYTNRVVCEWIRDDDKGFRFVLSGEGEAQWLQVAFDNPLAYRKVDEGDFLRTLGALRVEPRVVVYEAFNTGFLRWYSEETGGVSERRKVRHFIFLSQNDCIEVLSEEPHVISKRSPEEAAQ